MKIGDGYNFALGAALFIVTVTVVVPAAFQYVGIHVGPYDDSDNGFVKSGLKIRSDHLTGCEYLESWSGSLMPRVDRDGKQVCR